jgi:hypothetical protein
MPVLPPGTIFGYTDPGSPFENKVAWNQSPSQMLHSQIWELGNYLAFITGCHIRNHYNIERGSSKHGTRGAF